MASDATLDSVPATVSITVNPANSGPVANAGGDQLLVLSDSLIVSLDGNGSSPSGIEYAWTMVSKPRKSNSVLQGTTADTAFFDPDQAGTYEIQLEVTDDGSASAVDTATITIEKPPKDGDGGGKPCNPRKVVCG